jgi:cytochrome c biogenesis protein CcmG, thiol:disulfide interchange protein DsbE
MARWLKVVLLGVAALVAAQLLVQRSAPPFDTGEPHPELALPDLQGRTVDLARLRGRVVAVNFWATWCGPCREELPALAAVWRRQHDRCFELLGVAEESALEDVVRASASIPYPVLLDASADAVEPWRVPGYPKTVIVDAEGRIRRVFQGAIRAEQLEAAIVPLLPSTCPRS